MNIKINQLQRYFGEKLAVNIANFSAFQGELIGLVGNNGAGKTTLFRLMLDLLKPTAGTITLNDVPVAESEAWKMFTGAYIDDGFLIDFLTPEEFFSFIGQLSHLSKEELQGRLENFEPLFGGEIMGQKKLIRDLSAGNRHKVGIVSALLHNPGIVLLDEPFNYLDPSSQNVLKRLLKEYVTGTNAIVMVSSHNLQHTVDISTRIVLLENGEIVYDLANANREANTMLHDYFEEHE